MSVSVNKKKAAVLFHLLDAKGKDRTLLRLGCKHTKRVQLLNPQFAVKEIPLECAKGCFVGRIGVSALNTFAQKYPAQFIKAALPEVDEHKYEELLASCGIVERLTPEVYTERLFAGLSKVYSKIALIKIYRQIYGEGLRESKERVESLVNNFSDNGKSFHSTELPARIIGDILESKNLTKCISFINNM